MQEKEERRKKNMNIQEIMKRFEHKRNCKSIQMIYFIIKLIDEKNVTNVDMIKAYSESYFDVVKNTIKKSLVISENEQLIECITLLELI